MAGSMIGIGWDVVAYTSMGLLVLKGEIWVEKIDTMPCIGSMV